MNCLKTFGTQLTENASEGRIALRSRLNVLLRSGVDDGLVAAGSNTPVVYTQRALASGTTDQSSVALAEWQVNGCKRGSRTPPILLHLQSPSQQASILPATCYISINISLQSSRLPRLMPLSTPIQLVKEYNPVRTLHQIFDAPETSHFTSSVRPSHASAQPTTPPRTLQQRMQRLILSLIEQRNHVYARLRSFIHTLDEANQILQLLQNKGIVAASAAWLPDRHGFRRPREAADH